MDYFLSLMAALSIWLMGNKTWKGPAFGILNNLIWIVYAVMIKQYGLIFGSVLIGSIQIRNLILWRRNVNSG